VGVGYLELFSDFDGKTDLLFDGLHQMIPDMGDFLEKKVKKF